MDARVPAHHDEPERHDGDLMFLDARSIDDGAELEADVCVVGGGAAGITIARELATHRVNVCLLESGGLKPEQATQRLYEGENVGDRYRLETGARGALTQSRLRFFGGTTNHWVGFSRPLDEIDFEEREGIPGSGWPISRSDLESYYRRAHRICELGPYNYDAAASARIARTQHLAPDADVTTSVFRISTPTRFGQAYRKDLERARRVRVVLHANVLGLDASSEARTIERVRVATLQGRRFTVRARRFVLATGGIENARLLLASNDVRPRGIGNDNDLVGRYFADHPGGLAATVAVDAGSRALDFYSIESALKARTIGFISTTDAFVKSSGLLRFGVIVDKPPPGDESELRDGVAKLLQLSGGARDVRLRGLFMTSEVYPNRASRITLSSRRDALGMPRARVDWRFADPIRRSVARSLEAIGRSLARRGLARMLRGPTDDERFWSEEVTGESHHVGTTRMHRSSRRGVVDGGCRVHGTSNLYVAGSSVFPTTGFANPTLTIVALALRLADTLARDRQ